MKIYKSKQTKRCYIYAIQSFLSSVYKTKIPKADMEKYADRYCNEAHNHQEDVEDFFSVHH